MQVDLYKCRKNGGCGYCCCVMWIGYFTIFMLFAVMHLS